MTGVLLFQEILAILVLIFTSGKNGGENNFITFVFLAGKLAVLCLLAFSSVRFVALTLFVRYNSIPEYIPIASLAWCLLLAKSAGLLGLFYEMGAFLAGLSIASSQVSLVIAERLKPVREFFLRKNRSVRIKCCLNVFRTTFSRCPSNLNSNQCPERLGDFSYAF